MAFKAAFSVARTNSNSSMRSTSCALCSGGKVARFMVYLPERLIYGPSGSLIVIARAGPKFCREIEEMTAQNGDGRRVMNDE